MKTLIFLNSDENIVRISTFRAEIKKKNGGIEDKNKYSEIYLRSKGIQM